MPRINRARKQLMRMALARHSRNAWLDPDFIGTVSVGEMREGINPLGGDGPYWQVEIRYVGSTERIVRSYYGTASIWAIRDLTRVVTGLPLSRISVAKLTTGYYEIGCF